MTEAIDMYLEADDRLAEMKNDVDRQEGTKKGEKVENQNTINMKDNQINVKINIENSQIHNEIEGAISQKPSLVSAATNAVVKNMRDDMQR